MEAVGKKTPRFLFRGWHSGSGGSARSNSEAGIIPTAFLKDAASTGSKTSDAAVPTAFASALTTDRFPESIHDVSRSTLIQTINDHYTGVRKKTPFSSWSQSIQTALGFASSGSSSHISVIDTKRLPERILIVFTPEWQKLLGTAGDSYVHVSGGGRDYMAYGAIQSNLIASVSVHALSKAGLDLLVYNSTVRPGFRFSADKYPRTDRELPLTTQDKMSIANTIGSMFGSHFALGVAIHLMSFRHSRTPLEESVDEFINEFLSQSIPAEWYSDQTITSSEVLTGGNPVADLSIAVMRTLMQEKPLAPKPSRVAFEDIDEPKTHKKGKKKQSKGRTDKVRTRSVSRSRGRCRDEKGSESRSRSRSKIRTIDIRPRMLKELDIDMENV